MKKEVWIFGSHSGLDYVDNSRALFEYASSQRGVHAIWLTKSRNVLNKVNGLNFQAHLFYSVPGIYYALFSKYIILSYSYDDVSVFSYILARFKKVVQLFHGTPLKRLDIEVNRSHLNKMTRKILWLLMGKKYDLIISATEKVKDIFADFFDVDSAIVVPTGYPRNDVLLNNKKTLNIKDKLNIRTEERIILFMPTYREYSQGDQSFNLFLKYGFDAHKIERVLKKYNSKLIIKLHYRDYDRAEDIIKGVGNSEYIHFISPKHASLDVYQLVKESEILITDYSSIYFDYLLLNRPVIFTPFDEDEYKSKDRGFYFDYNDVTPGKKARNWNEVIREIDDVFSGRDNYIDKRRAVNNIFNVHQDSDSAKRAFEVIQQL